MLGDYSSFGTQAQGRKMAVSLFYLSFVLVYLVLQGEYADYSCRRRDNLFVSMLIIEVCLGVVFSHNNIILRIQMYYSVFSIVIIPNIIKSLRLKEEIKTIIKWATICILFIPYTIQILSNYGGIIPYSVQLL
jgi:hypothetical protein